MSKKLAQFLVVFVIILSILLPLPAFADPADPDDVEILTTYVNRNLLETGDWLVYVRYNVEYAVLPTDPINDNYIFKLMNGVTELGTILPYPYEDKGYNQGIASWYFDAATVIALGLVWNTEYTIRIDQNPVKFTTTPLTYPFTLPASSYSALVTTADNQEQTAERIINLATLLENAWVMTLLSEQDTGTVLEKAGEAYFRNAIAGSQVMAPNAYFIQTVEIDTGTRVWGTSLSDTYKERLWGPDGIEGTADDNWIWAWGIAPAADLINIPSILFIGLLVLIVCVFLIYKSQKQFQTPVPGYVGSLVVVMCGGMLALGFTLVALMALALVIVGGWFLLMRKA